MRTCAIMDIDGVYTNSRDWERFLPKQNTRLGWDMYNMHTEQSKPNPEMVNIAKQLQKIMPIFFVTSREDRGNMRKFSIKEIEDYSAGEIKIGGANKLFMRKENDFRPSAVVKKEILYRDIMAKGYKPVIAIDDSKSNIKMFEENGVGTKLYCIA